MLQLKLLDIINITQIITGNNTLFSYAKAIIESGEFSTIKELAQMVGYNDSLYFGKIFKQHYGTTPANMNQ